MHAHVRAGFTDNSTVSVVPTGDKAQVLSLTESVAGTFRVSTADLSTLHQVQFKDSLGSLLTTAHPTILDDGTYINLTSGVRCMPLPCDAMDPCRGCLRFLQSEAPRSAYLASRCMGK